MRILLIDDDMVDRRAVRRALRDVALATDLQEVTEGTAALKRLQDETFDCVLLDYHLPDINGLEWLNIAQRLCPLMPPVVMLTGQGNEIIAVETLKRGAQDYLVKSKLSSSELYRAMRYAVDVVRLQRQHLQAQEALRASEHRFRELVEGSVQGVLIHARGKPLFANQTLATLLGYETADEILCLHSVSALYAEHERDRLRRFHADRLAGRETPVHYEVEARRRDGTTVWLASSARVVQWEGLTAVQLTLIDITARKQAEAQLREQSEWFNITLASIGDGVIASNTHGMITFLNPVAERLTGWGAQDALGRPVEAIFRTRDEHTKQLLENPVTQVLRDGGIAQLATHKILVTRHGREIAIADSGAPIQSRDGTCHGVVLVFRDVSEPRRLEAELLRARKMESVGNLAGGIAHDFNNLLMGIMGNLSLARRLVTSQEHVAVRLEEAEKACRRATALTQQLLTFARGGAPVRQIVALADILEESATFSVRGSKARLEIAMPDDLWPIHADAGQISQVIHNIVLNAVQAMPEGGHIRAVGANHQLRDHDVSTLQAGPYVTLAIHDNGCGIPADVMPNIFDPYYTTKSSGNGLGLATADAIMRKHDGFITVRSEVNVGTTFVLYLPASLDTPQSLPPEERVSIQGQGRILVMDDEEMIRTILQKMLSYIGFAADCASDGDEAVRLYRQAQVRGEAYRLVILDITVPGGMGGIDAFVQLQRLDPNVKALLSSGYASDAALANFTAYGFCGVLAKPYTDQKLYATLKQVLDPDRAG